MTEKMDATLVQNLTEFCESRAHVYQFLSRCYEVEIDADFANRVTQDFSFTSENKDLTQALKAMREDLIDTSEAHLEQLAVVFNRVFFGMGPCASQKAFPYESVYTSEEGSMMQEAYGQATQVYRESRLQKNPSFPEPEDHLAIECAFMAHLCQQCLPALEAENEEEVTQLLREQQSFLKGHLLNWIRPFTADMKRSAEDGFYWYLAAFTEDFLIQEEAALSEVLD